MLIILTERFVCLTLGFGCLVGALLSTEDQWIFDNLEAQSPEQFETQYKGREYHLLQGLPAFSQNIPNVEMIRNGGFGTIFLGWNFGWGERAPGQHHDNVAPNLVVGFGLLFLYSFVALGGVPRPWSGKLSELSWPHARASVKICSAILTGLCLLFVSGEAAFMQELNGKSIPNNNRIFMCKANLETVSEVIQKWANQSGYEMGNQCNWIINTVPFSKPVAEAGIREAWKPSPFDRWRATWTSFHRVSPHLAFQLVSSEDPVETRAYITPGFLQSIPKDLISALEKMESAPSPAPGDKDPH